MTPAEWEAEKARIDEERAKMADAISRYMIYQQSESAATFAARVLPYPPKPEKTVTLSDGQVWRRNAGRFEFHVLSEWFGFRDDDDIRALASLLPENDT